MKVKKYVEVVANEKEWNTLNDAISVLDQLLSVISNYENESEIVKSALNRLKEVCEDVIDDYE